MPFHSSPLLRLQAVIAAQRDIMDAGMDLDRVMEVTTSRARELTSAAGAVLELRDGEEMVYRAASGGALGLIGLRLGVRTSLSGLAVLQREILSCVDCDDDPRVDRAATRKLGARSMLCVPLFHQGEAIGVLKVYSPKPNAFDAEDISTLELMVAFIAAAMSNALAQRALASSEQRFRSLAELASDGIITADACGVVTYVNRSASRMFGVDEQALIGRPMLSLMPARFALTLQDSQGNFDPERARKLVGKTLEVKGVRADGSDFPVELSASTWSAGNERFFTAIVRDITERKRLESAVLTLARTDHLTGLLNRRAGEELIERELDRAVRYGRALSFVLVDIDHFKRVNDSFGHAAGDAVLRRMGQLVVARIRATDLAVRWGGEELLLCLPETDLEGAQDLAESLRSMIEQTQFEGVGAVTASLGVAARAQGERAEQTISRADERMYAAKSNGRNRVEI